MANAKRLTAKQEVFVVTYCGGVSATEAYRRVYNARSMAPTTVNTEASRLLHHPKIGQRIQDIRDGLFKNRLWPNEGRIIAELQETLNLTQEHHKFSAAKKSLELIAQISGLLPVRGRWRKRPQHSGYADQVFLPFTDEEVRALFQKALAAVGETRNAVECGAVTYHRSHAVRAYVLRRADGH